MFGWELFLETGFYLFLACFCGRKTFHLLTKAQFYPVCRLCRVVEKAQLHFYGGFFFTKSFQFIQFM